MATFYIDGDTLAESTSIYSDADMTTCASNGFYSDGTIVRELVDCVLLPAQTCPSCLAPCGVDTISYIGGQGIYLTEVDVGSNTGQITISFNPATVPDGIRVTYDGVVYNSVSSPNHGFLQSSNSGELTFLGTQSADCGVSESTYNDVTVYRYNNNGGLYENTGNTQTVSVGAGDVVTETTDAGDCVMVIPKPNASPSTIEIEIAGLCPTTQWDFTVFCPEDAFGFTGTVNSVDSTAACSTALDQGYYHVPVTGSVGTPLLYDFVYMDVTAETPLPQGWYGVDPAFGTGYPIYVSADGIITIVGTC